MSDEVADNRRRKGRETAGNILSIARRSFAEHGYEGTVTDDIIVEAGITKGALYHHFSSKRQLFEAVYRAAEEDVAERISQASNLVDEPWDKLLAGCFAYLEICQDPGLRQIMRIDAPAALGLVRWSEIDREYGVERLVPFLKMLQDQGVIRLPVVEAFAWQLTGAMNEATFWIAQHPHPEEAQEQSKEALRLVLQSIRVDTLAE